MRISSLNCCKCGLRPRLKNRRVCNKCKYLRQKNKPEKIEKKGLIMVGFYVNTPHKVDRQMKRDCFNGYY